MILSQNIEKQARYTVIIHWSPDDQIFVVSLPEWGPYCKTHGTTYEEAAKNAREVLEQLMAGEQKKSVDLPAEKFFHHPGADVVNLPDLEAGAPPVKSEGTRSRKSA